MFSRFFINRPIVAMVISILMVIVGIVVIVQLPVSLYPNIAPPEILLQASYPGADALTLEPLSRDEARRLVWAATDAAPAPVAESTVRA